MTQFNPGNYATMHPMLEEHHRRATNFICRPYYPNQERLYWKGQELRSELGLKKAAKDEFKILRLRVDPNPDFTWPFTIVDDDGQLRYIFLNGIHDGTQVLPHMESAVTWMNIGDFDRYDFHQVVGGRLSVGGSWFDTARGLYFDYAIMPYVTANAVSCDTHTVLDSSFDWARFVARRDGTALNVVTGQEYPVERGQHPQPFTLILEEHTWDPEANPDGLWRPVRKHHDTRNYLGELEADGQMAHVLWEKHNTRLTHGAGVDQVAYENMLLHAYTRDMEPLIFYKGLTDPEFFGIYKPQVVIQGDPYAQVNLAGLQLYQEFDLIIIDGEALSHCVLNTVKQLVEFAEERDPDQLTKLVVITDGSSVIPGFEDATQTELQAMAAKNGGDSVKLLTYEEAYYLVRQNVQMVT